MRTITEYVARDGSRTYRVRFRSGGMERSETFRIRRDAKTFVDLLDAGGPDIAVQWLDGLRAGAGEDSITFGQWFTTYVDQLTGVTDRTRDSYRAIHRNHLAHLDPQPLPLLTRAHVTEIVNRLDTGGKSPKTIKNVIHMLSSCLALAIDEGHMARNPCRRVRLPKAALTDHDARFLTLAEFGRLHAATHPHYQPLVAFLAGTGLRWSEATALQCRHVDLTTGTVHVRQAWKQQGGRELGPPKTEKGRRTVNPATGALVAVAPLIREPDDWLFTTPTGAIVRHANFYNRIWKPACKASGIDTTIHTLRHTHASWLISDGQSLEAVQDQLGHESILTTRAVYGHLLPAIGVEVGRSASRSLEQALGNAVEAGPSGPAVALPASLPRISGRPD